jgi:F0F1-type ATP synthase delta subunit
MLTADSLAKAISTLPHADGVDSAKSIVTLLKTKGALALLPRVVGSLSRIAEKTSSGEVVVVAHINAKKNALAAAETLGINSKEVIVRTDDTLIGGYIVSKKGVQIDASYKSALLSVYRSAVRG